MQPPTRTCSPSTRAWAIGRSVAGWPSSELCPRPHKPLRCTLSAVSSPSRVGSPHVGVCRYRTFCRSRHVSLGPVTRRYVASRELGTSGERVRGGRCHDGIRWAATRRQSRRKAAGSDDDRARAVECSGRVVNSAGAVGCSRLTCCGPSACCSVCASWETRLGSVPRSARVSGWVQLVAGRGSGFGREVDPVREADPVPEAGPVQGTDLGPARPAHLARHVRRLRCRVR